METTTKILRMLANRGVTLEMFEGTSLWICFPQNSGLTFDELERLRNKLLPDLGDSEIWASEEKDGGIIISIELPDVDN